MKIPTPKNPVLFATLLFTVGLYLLSGLFQNDFIVGDDTIIVANNPDIRSFSNVPKFFMQPYHFMYCPIKMVSHTLDYAVSGLEPWGHRLFSLLYHLINVVLVFRLVSLLLSKLWGSEPRVKQGASIAALLFAIHPMNVETVAWLTGRGDLLYGGFFLGGLISYIHYLTKGFRYRHLVITFALFALSGLSKSSAFTFPLVLLVLDGYYGRRMVSWRVVLEKTPFVAGALALGLSSIALRGGHAMPMEQYLALVSPVDFVAITLYPPAFYLVKFVVPLKLALPYPHPITSTMPLSWDFYVYPLLLVGLVGLLFRKKTFSHPGAFSVLFYLAATVSVLRLTPIFGALYSSIAADRYVYVPMVGLVFFVGWVWGRLPEYKGLWKKWGYPAFMVGLIGLSGMMSVMSYERIRVFRNAETLFNDAHRKYPHHIAPLCQLAGTYHLMGDAERAAEILNEVALMQPENIEPTAMLFDFMIEAERYAEALQAVDRILSIDPSLFKFYLSKAGLHVMLDQPDRSLITLHAALAYAPDKAASDYIMQSMALVADDVWEDAVKLFHQGNFDKALSYLNTLIELLPPHDKSAVVHELRDVIILNTSQ